MKKIITLIALLLTLTLSACNINYTTYELVGMEHNEFDNIDEFYEVWEVSFNEKDLTYKWVEQKVGEEDKTTYTGTFEITLSYYYFEQEGYEYKFLFTDNGLSYKYGATWIFKEK